MNRLNTGVWVVALVCLFGAAVVDAAIPTSERDALIAIYNSTGGPGWNDSTNWLGAAGSECTWNGVICSPSDLNVIELNLVGNNLVGSLPSELTDLTQLEVIYLGWNQMTGALPLAVTSLPMLRILAMPGNQLDGSIPPELGSLSSLESLNLRNNQLSGSIPPELGSLSSLESLNLRNNQLSGNIPPELGSITTLADLLLANNQLTGAIPVELGTATALRRLLLNGNQLIGAIPPELGSLSALEEIDLSSNQLSGSIPTALGSLSNLIGLWLSDNRLTGSIPAELGNLTVLEQLHMWGNRLTGSIPPELASITTLNWVDLAGNRLTGAIPPEFGACPNLGGLLLAGNQLDGTIPVVLGSVSTLNHLDLSGNQLTGTIPPELGSLSNLGWLSLSDNRLAGPIPPELGNLVNLTDLILNSNSLDGPIPPEVGNLVSLGHLSLHDNNLTGTLPPEIGSLSNLGELFLAWNQLSGAIPPEIGSLGSLWGLDLSHNRLEGTIPPEFASLSNLQWMNLRSNNLMGPVPLNIDNLGSLGDNSSDIEMNGLYSTDPGVIGFLDAKCGPEWKNVQTVMPAGFSVFGATGLSVTLGWDPIPFNWNPGGYDVFVSSSASGPFEHLARAVDKTANAWTLFGLLPNTTYHFKICSVTEANSENQNTVVSELTAPLMVATSGSPSTWYAATTGVVGNDCATPATPCPTIQMALDAAAPGEVVHIAPGTYTETLAIDEPVMLVGAGADTTIIEGWGWAPVVDVFPFSQLDLSGVTIRNGQVQFGAGVYVGWRGRLEMRDAVVTMNHAQIMGGGVHVECEAGAVLERVTITDNMADERGGGLGACGWTHLVDSSVSGNSAPWGGGVAVNGRGRIESSTIADNTATDFGGGGVVNEGWLTVVDSTIHGNSASLGGGFANMQWANVSLENSTLSSNDGGGLFNDYFAVAGLDGCTVADNSGIATEHSGVMNWDSVAVHSTILAGNTPANCANPVTSYGYNLESSFGCALDGPSDLSGAPALLGPLTDNGGPTWTHALEPGSAAIDAGDPAGFYGVDQRGFARPVDGDNDSVAVPDIGAVEFHGLIFLDGFESGNTSMWSVTSP